MKFKFKYKLKYKLNNIYSSKKSKDQHIRFPFV